MNEFTFIAVGDVERGNAIDLYLYLQTVSSGIVGSKPSVFHSNIHSNRRSFIEQRRCSRNLSLFPNRKSDLLRFLFGVSILILIASQRNKCTRKDEETMENLFLF